MTATYPLPDDYNRAVQNPSRAFGPLDLRRATFPTPPGRSVPQAVAGSNAVVFRARVGGRDEAVRFFTRPASSSKERYSALAGFVTSNGLASALPATRWVTHGVQVNGAWWPLIRMDWVPGTPLDEHVDTLVDCGDTTGLASLADSWRAFVSRLQTADVAHGDLQHGNVLVANGQFVLVDLDGVWLPSLAHLAPPEESGHVNYQPADPGVPTRTRWGRYMDTFPALVIHLSLRALSHDLSLWDKYWSEQNLVFSREDLAPPFETDLWDDLAAITDPRISTEMTRLREACSPGAHTDCRLDALLEDAPATSTTAPKTTAAVTPWWTETVTPLTSHPTSQHTSQQTNHRSHHTQGSTVSGGIRWVLDPADDEACVRAWRHPKRAAPPPPRAADPDWWKRSAGPSTRPDETSGPEQYLKLRATIWRLSLVISAIPLVVILGFTLYNVAAPPPNTAALHPGTTSSTTFAAYGGQYPTNSPQTRIDYNTTVSISCRSRDYYWLALSSSVRNSSGYYVPGGYYIPANTVTGVNFSDLPWC